MTATRWISTLLLPSILAIAGCASSAPQAESPAPVPKAEPAPPVAEAPRKAAAEAEAPPSATVDAKDDPEPGPAPENTPAAKTEAETPPTPPSELLTAEGVAFVLDWQASTPVLILTEKCEKRVGDDPDALARCVESERKTFSADVLRFRKVGGQLRWTVYKRDKDRLQVVYSVPYTFTDETDYSVSLLLQGKGTGYMPVMAQKSTIPLSFPSIYSIELNDPVWGSLVYTSKRGLVMD
ncbi:MAG: hypothetical protein JW751_30520 [Polyangiaceae bacterium]|nr:hypothetical protein [Polyangiaceae bacterium]